LCFVLVNKFLGNGAKSEPDENGENDGIVKMTDHRDEIRDEINGGRSVYHGCAEQPTGKPRTTRISEERPVHVDLTPERPHEICESLFQFLFVPNSLFCDTDRLLVFQPVKWDIMPKAPLNEAGTGPEISR